MTIQDITNKYKGKIDYLDLEILIANSLGKTREFVLTYPDQSITKIQNTKINKNIKRRIAGEPLAYIVMHKEFYGLDFVVNKHTLIPRPETEMIVENVLHLMQNSKCKMQNATIIDIGTGSGCIITAIASNEKQSSNITFLGSDISKDALIIAKKNAKINCINNKIKFIQSDLLSRFIKEKRCEIKDTNLIVTANLPYLSKEIYASSPVDVKKFEPKSALYSAESGLRHYRILLEQLSRILDTKKRASIICFLEISPEQKLLAIKVIRKILPTAKISFQKDLAGKWRVCKIEI
ncbi:MAG: peptide chain release factor N(5)-glutamine methyltransferase [bacterium]